LFLLFIRRSDMKEQLTEVFSRYEGTRNELIPILQDVQDSIGYLPTEAMSGIARFLNMPESTVYGVVTFYAQFYLERQGDHTVKICRGTACHVKGSKELMDSLCAKLDVEPGGTTKDYKFTLERVACFGSCALAPVMVVDDKVYGSVTPKKAEEIIDAVE
jgi:NADH-quinone oxidoreductase subunit E